MTWKGSNDSTWPSVPSSPPDERTLILASHSARRRELMVQAGYRFQVVPSAVDESTFAVQGVDAVTYARQLALAKARDVAARFPRHWVLGADTVVESDGRIIGKPADAVEAERIIRQLLSGPHRVITGLALVRRTARLEFVESDTTIVYPRPMTDEQISQHIQGGTWQGKAGAYAIQERGDTFVDRLDGSFTNVVGLPLERLGQVLAEAGYRTE